MEKTKKLLKLLKRLIKQEHLFDDQKLREYKSQIKTLEKQIAKYNKEQSKGFGN